MHRRRFLAAIAPAVPLVAGCAGSPNDGTTASGSIGSSDDPGASTDTASTAGTTTGTEFPELDRLEGSYEGPLISAHEHFLSYRQMADVLDWYVDWMGARGLGAAVSFLSSRRLELISDHSAQFLPFDMGPVGRYVNAVRLGGNADAPARSDLASIYRSELEGGTPWVGIGEFPLYMLSEPGTEPPMPDADFLSATYEVAAEYDVTVMVHPPYDRQFGFHPWEGDRRDHPLYRSLARMLGEHPETTFLVHGIEREHLSFVPQLLSAFDNWLYDVSGIVNRTGEPPFFTEFGLSRSEQEEARAAFVDGMTDDRLRTMIDESYAAWEPILTNHADRVVWGIDALFRWHYDPDVLDTWLRFFRGLLGELPTEAARLVAHENARDAWLQ